MIAHEKLLGGRYGYVTHTTNEGMHKVNLDDKTYVKFLNFSGYGCTGTWRMAFSPHNNRIYIDCRQNRRESKTLEFDPSTDRVTRVFPFRGYPYVSPNGHFIVSIYRNGRDVSVMNIIAISGTTVNRYPEHAIPGGLTDVVFYPKRENPNSYYVFATLQYTNRMAVVDLDLASRRDDNAVRYITDVDYADTTRFLRSRKMFMHGKWIISAASQSNTTVIVNAETQKIHGKIPNIDKGDYALWVPDPNSGTSGLKSFVVTIWFCLFLKFFF